jgi:hypothetical protein
MGVRVEAGQLFERFRHRWIRRYFELPVGTQPLDHIEHI